MAIFVLFGAVMALVLLNIPIAIALGVVALVAILLHGGPEALANVPLVMYTGATGFPLIAIPLFILAGAIMNASGISRRTAAGSMYPPDLTVRSNPSNPSSRTTWAVRASGKL